MSFDRGDSTAIAGKTSVLAIEAGGTNASTANDAINNLLPDQENNADKYLKTDGTNTSWEALSLDAGSLTGTVAIANGGTGATDASTARTNLGLGTAATTDSTDYAPAAQGVTNGDSHDHSGGDGAQIAYSSLSGTPSLGTISSQNANNVTITGGSITGITDLAVADGGTGASTLTGYVKGNGTSAFTASSTIPNTDITGLGTISTQAASNVSITGGSITGITDLAVADGGTGASTAQNARINLLPSYTGNANKILAVNVGETDVSWVSSGAGSGDVVGPASSTDNAIVRFDGTTGKLVQNSAVTISDTTGSLNFTATGARITGDFSNATIANRVLFQSSTVDGNTIVGAIPNGSSERSDFILFNSDDTANASFFDFICNNTINGLSANKSGTGTYLPMTFATGGSERMRVTTAGGVSFGSSGTAYGTTGQVLTSQGNAPPIWSTVSSGLVFLSTVDFNNTTSTADFTLTSGYDAYMFVLGNVIPATDAVSFNLRTSADGGSTFASATDTYRYAYVSVEGSPPTSSATLGTSVNLAADVGSAVGEDGISGVVMVHFPNLVEKTIITYDISFQASNSVLVYQAGTGWRAAAEANNAIRFLFSSGNLESGSITLYGLKNS